MFVLLLRVWVTSFVLAMPIGPIGMLCIKRTLETGFVGALLVGTGAALADSVYGAITAFGISQISDIMLANILPIKFAGGVFLLYLAYKELRAHSNAATITLSNKTQLQLITKTFILTIVNPITILTFFGVFATLNIKINNSLESAIVTIGVFGGSMTWWIILGNIVNIVKNKFSLSWIKHIKYLSGLILVGFGVFSILDCIKTLIFR